MSDEGIALPNKNSLQEIKWVASGANFVVHSGDIQVFTAAMKSDIDAIKKAVEHKLSQLQAEVDPPPPPPAASTKPSPPPPPPPDDPPCDPVTGETTPDEEPPPPGDDDKPPPKAGKTGTFGF